MRTTALLTFLTATSVCFSACDDDDVSTGDAGAVDAARVDGGGDGGTSASTQAAANMSFFITSDTSPTGNLGGLAAADARCQRLATAAGSTKSWRAYLSTSTENARSRIGTGPWFNFQGEMVAATLAQLHEEGGEKNNITQATALTDLGVVVAGRVRDAGVANEHDVLTGSTMAGLVKAGMTCSDWTSETGMSGVGHADRMGVQADPIVAASWNGAHEGQCNDTKVGGGAGRLYCFATN